MKYLLSLYSIFILSFTLFSFLYVDPGLFYFQKIYSGVTLDHREVTTVIYILSICILFVFYVLFLRFAKKGIMTIGHFLLLLILSSFLFFSYPAMLSFDIFNYVTTAKVTYFYKENPYVVMPIEFIGEPYLSFTHAANKLALYGPLWILITSIPYYLGFGNFILTIYLFKLLVFIFYFLLVYFIWKKTKNLVAVVFFALNPLVLIESLVSGHNDIVVMFFAVLGIFLIERQKRNSLFVLVTSFFMKYMTIVLFPVFFYLGFLKRDGKKISLAKVSTVCTVLMMIVVFIAGPIREEIYPWYAIWFISFAAFSTNKFLRNSCIIISFGLLFRYMPFMYTGSHFGLTPTIKSIVTFAPVIFFVLFEFSKKIWKRKTLLR